jgi:hypothetical protein
MSNERYLIVSYFLFAITCPGVGILAYLILRRPFERVAEATMGSRGPVLKRLLAVSMTVAAILGFLGFSYNQKGCVSYQQVVSNRYFLVQANVEQVQAAADWIAWTVLAWGVVVAIWLSALRKRKAGE